MILRAGLAATHLVTFASGQPDGDVTWQLLADDGTVIDDGVITPAAQDVSVLIPLSALATELPNGEWMAPLDVTWSYSVDGALVNGEARYNVEARLPLGIGPNGVRQKLGVSYSELPDSEIPLVQSYLIFEDEAGVVLFATALGSNPLTDLRIKAAIEAMAALMLIPTMPVRVANSESSGTNEFKRQNIDWNAIAADLAAIIDLGYSAVDPAYDPLANTGTLFLLAPPSRDSFTGA